MFGVTITVRGPGQVINYEMILIRRALERAGYAVKVENDYPILYRNDGPTTEDEYLAFRRNLDTEGPYIPEVTLIADHLPWGG